MSVEIEESQATFLQRGGTYALGLAYHYKNGTLSRERVYREYPKILRISKGTQEVEKSTQTCDKQVVRWTETVEMFDDIVVHDEAEEERILSGGKTSVQIEEDRQALIRRASGAGINVDPSWSAVRLRRELGDKLDAPPTDELGALKEKLRHLQEIAEAKAQIAALELQLASRAGDDLDDMRGQLTALGVKVDGRWSAGRLREELDRATAPGAA